MYIIRMFHFRVFRPSEFGVIGGSRLLGGCGGIEGLGLGLLVEVSFGKSKSIPKALNCCV